MADINDTNITPPDDIDFDSYETGGSSTGKKVVLPTEGRHQLRTESVEWGRTQEGYLKATLTVTNLEPGSDADGHEIRFVRLSTKRYSNRNANMMLDYLRAFGIDARPRTDEEYQALVDRTVGGTFEGGVKWEARDPDSQQTVARSMNDFPLDDNGNRLQYLTRKSDGQRLWGRARISYFVNKVGTAA